MNEEVKKDNIVQIVDENHHWYPSLIIVDEVKGFGIQGYIVIPTNDKKPNNPAYIRLNTDQFEVVGNAVLVSP